MKETIEKILKEVNAYTIKNNIAEIDNSAQETSVVCLEDLERYLRENVSTEYDVMKSQHCTLLEFLMSEETLKCSKGWSYEVMTIIQYKRDIRQLNNRFLALKLSLMEDTQLLVMYLDSPTRSFEESLTSEMIECYEVKKNYKVTIINHI